MLAQQAPVSLITCEPPSACACAQPHRRGRRAHQQADVCLLMATTSAHQPQTPDPYLHPPPPPPSHPLSTRTTHAHPQQHPANTTSNKAAPPSCTIAPHYPTAAPSTTTGTKLPRTWRPPASRGSSCGGGSWPWAGCARSPPATPCAALGARELSCLLASRGKGCAGACWPRPPHAHETRLCSWAVGPG